MYNVSSVEAVALAWKLTWEGVNEISYSSGLEAAILIFHFNLGHTVFQ